MTRLFRWPVFVCFISVMMSVTVQAQNSKTVDPVNLFVDMSTAFSQLSYDGIFVHSENNQMSSMRVKHQRKEGKEYESLVDLDGHKIKVLRIGDTVICVYPDASYANQKTLAMAPFQRFKSVEIERLKQGYQLRVGNKMGRIAGRDARVLYLVPKDHYRFSHELWLDVKNHFLLKHDIIDANKDLLDRIQFTAVNFRPRLTEADFTPNKNAYVQEFVEPEARPVKSQWTFDWLPAGFHLVWPEARGLNHSTSMLLLSDGMASISVFVEPTQQDKALSVLHMGATVVGEKTLKVGNTLYLVTMVGEVPTVTIDKLMTVFRPKAPL